MSVSMRLARLLCDSARASAAKTIFSHGDVKTLQNSEHYIGLVQVYAPHPSSESSSGGCFLASLRRPCT